MPWLRSTIDAVGAGHGRKLLQAVQSPAAGVLGCDAKIVGSSAQSGSAEASPPGSGVAAAEAAYEKNFGTASGTPDAEATSMHEDTG